MVASFGSFSQDTNRLFSSVRVQGDGASLKEWTAVAYRIVPEPGEEFETDPALLLWGVDIEHRRIPTTEKSSRRRMMAHILAERPEAHRCFKELVKKGCDRTSLRRSLQSLALPQAEPISQKDAEKAAALLQEAAETVSQVNRTALVAQLDPDRRFVGLDNLLHDYADRLSRVAPSATKRISPTRDETRARLIAHVTVRTGDPHDEEIAELVDAVVYWAKTMNPFDGGPLDSAVEPSAADPVSTEGHRKWRDRHQGLIEEHLTVEQESFTAWQVWRAADRGLKGLKGKGLMQRHIPVALLAARELYPDRGWRRDPPPRRLSKAPSNPVAILCADWAKESGKRAVYVADVPTRTIRRLAGNRWSLSAVLDEAKRLSGQGSVLATFDLPLGVPKSYLDTAATLPSRGTLGSFLDLLTEARSAPGFFDATTVASAWKIKQPFFSVPAGSGGLRSYVESAARQGVDLYRMIDRRTGAKTPFAKSGIPGTVGSAACALWKELGSRLKDNRGFKVWPFEGDLDALLRSSPVVLGEIYPRAAYATALIDGPIDKRPRLFLAKGDPRVRQVAVGNLQSAKWVRH